MGDDPKPWGMFRLVSKDPAEERDHLYFLKTVTSVGRNPVRADAIVDLLFISGVHCIVTLEGVKENGTPIVKVQDMSRNGIYVNEERLGRPEAAEIEPNSTIHFTKPGLSTKGVPPTVYRYEVLRDGLTPENAILRAEKDRADAEKERAAARRPPTAGGMTTPASAKGLLSAVAPTQLLTGKRQRRGEDAIMHEEMEVEVTTTLSSGSRGVSPSPASMKRRRTGDRADGDDGAFLETTAQLQMSTQSMSSKRHRTGDGADDEDQTLLVRSIQNMPSKRRRPGEDADDEDQTRSERSMQIFSSKRRRTGDRDDDEDQTLLETTAHIQKSNQSLRLKLKEAAEREAALKQSISRLGRESDSIKDQLQIAEETQKLAENELMLKNERLVDREHEAERLKEENAAMKTHVEELNTEMMRVRAEAAGQAQVVGQLKAEREKIEMDMVSMTSRLDVHQTKIRQLEEKIKQISEQNGKLHMTVDAAQTRTDLVEEGKRGVLEENSVLKARLKSLFQVMKHVRGHMDRAFRIVVEENSIMSQELEELQRSDNSILSSEQSQPAPTQENIIPDTQPEDGDEEQTLDQDEAAARAGLVGAGGDVGPFSSSLSRISLHQSMSADLLDVDQQQPVSADIGLDDTPVFHTEPEGKSSLSESTLSSHSSSSKTPPAPPLQRTKIQAPQLALSEEVEESKEEKSNDDKEVGEEAEKEADSGNADGEAGETAQQEDDEGENDKENTPVEATDDDAAASTKSAQQPGQQGWLQLSVTNEEDKSEQVSASEGGGIFDDETQLSVGE